MNTLLETVSNFFATIAGIIEAFFGFLGGLIPGGNSDDDTADAE